MAYALPFGAISRVTVLPEARPLVLRVDLLVSARDRHQHQVHGDPRADTTIPDLLFFR